MNGECDDRILFLFVILKVWESYKFKKKKLKSLRFFKFFFCKKVKF